MKGIRAAVCHDVHSAQQSVEHDDVNIMCIGTQIVGPWLAKDLITARRELVVAQPEEESLLMSSTELSRLDLRFRSIAGDPVA
jgi:ribose 5-phosphate isomerase RpiB